MDVQCNKSLVGTSVHQFVERERKEFFSTFCSFSGQKCGGFFRFYLRRVRHNARRGTLFVLLWMQSHHTRRIKLHEKCCEAHHTHSIFRGAAHERRMMLGERERKRITKSGICAATERWIIQTVKVMKIAKWNDLPLRILCNVGNAPWTARPRERETRLIFDRDLEKVRRITPSDICGKKVTHNISDLIAKMCATDLIVSIRKWLVLNKMCKMNQNVYDFALKFLLCNKFRLKMISVSGYICIFKRTMQSSFGLINTWQII